MDLAWQTVLLIICVVDPSTTTEMLEMNSVRPCPSGQNTERTLIQNIDLIFHAGCTVSLECKYSQNFCYSMTTTNLVIIPPSSTLANRMNILHKGKCHLVVELRNMTTDFSGKYVCNDTINGSPRQRVIAVGYPPVKPTHLSLVYQPMHFINFKFNRVLTGEKLNDPHTRWSVTYKWGKDHELTCYRRSSVPDFGLYVAYTIDHRDLSPDMWTRYYDKGYLGNIFAPIRFSVTVKNMFGEAGPIHKSFRAINYIRPEHLTCNVINRGMTWLLINVSLPVGINKRVCQQMGRRSKASSRLRIKYTVTPIPESEQSQKLTENMKFYHLYGIWRNIDNDEQSSSTYSSSVGYPLVKVYNWTQFDCAAAHLNVTGLLPYTRVNISLQAVGRYLGPVFTVNIDDTITDEDVPLVGPKFAANLCYCFMEGLCMTCAIYFLEIPRSLRGGRVIQYTLNGTSLSTGHVSLAATQCENTEGFFTLAATQCENTEGFFTLAKGSDNTILVRELEPHTVYNLSLQAHVRKGMSPATNYVLHVRTSLSPSHITVEKNRSMYTVRWHSHFKNDSNTWQNVTYYVHYCYAQNFDDLTDVTNNLNCRTNMVTEVIEGKEQKQTVQVRHYQGSKKELTPTFFVSMTSPEGNSGLSKAECLYSHNKVPAKAESLTVQQSDTDPCHLVVTFNTPCSQHYNNGRPDGYRIVLKHSSNCPPCLIAEQDFVSEVDANEHGRHITKTFTNLLPNTVYCVGICGQKKTVLSLKQWTWAIASTGDVLPKKDDELNGVHMVVISLSVALCVVSAVVLFVCCILKCKSTVEKFDSARTLPKPQKSYVMKSPETASSRISTENDQVNSQMNYDSGIITNSTTDDGLKINHSNEVDKRESLQSMDVGQSSESTVMTRRTGHNFRRQQTLSCPPSWERYLEWNSCGDRDKEANAPPPLQSCELSCRYTTWFESQTKADNENDEKSSTEDVCECTSATSITLHNDLRREECTSATSITLRNDLRTEEICVHETASISQTYTFRNQEVYEDIENISSCSVLNLNEQTTLVNTALLTKREASMSCVLLESQCLEVNKLELLACSHHKPLTPVPSLSLTPSRPLSKQH